VLHYGLQPPPDRAAATALAILLPRAEGQADQACAAGDQHLGNTSGARPAGSHVLCIWLAVARGPFQNHTAGPRRNGRRAAQRTPPRLEMCAGMCGEPTTGRPVRRVDESTKASVRRGHGQFPHPNRPFATTAASDKVGWRPVSRRPPRQTARMRPIPALRRAAMEPDAAVDVE
jgi:hypothetical protein